MADREQVERLKRSVEEWNEWRQEHPDIRPDLSFADLRHATLNGAGDLNVWASKYLNAKMAGVGDLSYKGHPVKVDRDKSGVGDINEVD